MSVDLNNIWGRAQGNFSPYFSNRRMVEELEKVQSKFGFRKLFIPKCNFTNRIVTLGQEDDLVDDDNAWLVRSKNPADGGIVEEANAAVVILNADCPVVFLHDEHQERLAVLHAGLRCLVPPALRDKKSDSKAKRSIIQVAFEDYNFHHKSTKAFIGYGIGPCCYGAENHEEMLDITLNLPIGRATRGPRAGQRSVDLYRLAYEQLIKLGLAPELIDCDYLCTSCALSSAGRPTFYSHSREQKGRDIGERIGRNATFGWFAI